MHVAHTLRKAAIVGLLVALVLGAPPAHAQPPRRIGVAFGGGSARGIAHIGVIQWFEEHRVPIDLVAGTSMGGLIGGAFASGMSAAELRDLITQTDWDVMFGSSSFAYKNYRRKEDARSYPSRLEFGLKGGIVPPTALNNGQQVDLLLARIAAPYFALERFDDLPTPLRTIATDLIKAERIVIDSGSLAQAMRATMSLPGVFPPVQVGDRVLVDGGTLDNIPADVVRDMGATAVVAIDVGYSPTTSVDYSLFGLLGSTLDSMMRANTRRAIAAADHMITVDVTGFGSLAWRRSDDLIKRGYEAADKMSAELLKYAVSEPEWKAWLDARTARRRTTIPQPQFITTAGLTQVDAILVRRQLAHHMSVALDVPSLEKDLARLSGLDRYEGLTWLITGPPGREGLMIRAKEKTYAPPFLMMRINLENTASDDFRAQVAGRYLAFDVLGTSTELRIDAVLGSDPSIATSWYRPIVGRLFVRPYAAASKRTFDVFVEEQNVAVYREGRMFAGGDLGLNVARESELTGGIRVGWLDAGVHSGDPRLPELSGLETVGMAKWAWDGQDSPIVPSRGLLAGVVLTHYLQSPDIVSFDRTNDKVTQLEGTAVQFWSYRRANRLFLVASGGTSFDGRPLPTAQFTLGQPFRLDAFGIGERRGDHFGVLTAGYLRRVGRLPDFIGGSVFAGAWLENGAAFNSHEDVDLQTNFGTGIILDTLIGPVLTAVTVGSGGDWRILFGVGKLFR